GGAEAILIPEIPFSYQKVADAINKMHDDGVDSALMVVAEGAKPLDGEQIVKDSNEGGEIRLGGLGEQVADEIAKRTGRDTRSVTLGHLQRGGTPTSWDRVLATRFGVKAVKMIEDGEFGRMVSYQQYHVGSVSIEEAVEKLNVVDPQGEVVEAAKAVGICFGD
ncbi:MAG: 6-phosphofructokinase, partial [Verrucomicrobiota bacterium]